MTDDVGDEERRASIGSLSVVVQVATQLGAGCVAAMDFEAVDERFGAWQESLLKRAGIRQLGFQALHVAAVFSAVPAQVEAAVDQRFQHLAIERLLDEIEGATLDGPDKLLVLILEASSHQDDVEVGLERFQAGHELEAVKLRHADVKNRELWSEVQGDARRLA